MHTDFHLVASRFHLMRVQAPIVRTDGEKAVADGYWIWRCVSKQTLRNLFATALKRLAHHGSGAFQPNFSFKLIEQDAIEMPPASKCLLKLLPQCLGLVCHAIPSHLFWSVTWFPWHTLSEKEAVEPTNLG
jgi:hypothetical protein